MPPFLPKSFNELPPPPKRGQDWRILESTSFLPQPQQGHLRQMNREKKGKAMKDNVVDLMDYLEPDGGLDCMAPR
jgi:hypothetical protein